MCDPYSSIPTPSPLFLVYSSTYQVYWVILYVEHIWALRLGVHKNVTADAASCCG